MSVEPGLRPISLSTCIHAVAGVAAGLVSPRRPSHAELSAIPDAGLPRSTTTVKFRVLPHTTRSAPALLTEGRLRGTLPLAYASFLVEHPRARLLIDPGIRRDARRRTIDRLQLPLRLVVRPPTELLATVDALALAGVDPASVDAAVPTHLHWDHVNGLADLPNLDVWVHTDEWAWAMGPGPAPAGGVRDVVGGRPLETYALDGPPVLSFPRSRDVFGDGSVVLVDLAGHTPGSVGVLLHTNSGWVLLVGDAVWLGVQVTEARQKAALPGLFVDDDREGTWQTLLRVHVAGRHVRVVPTHDPAALHSVPYSEDPAD